MGSEESIDLNKYSSDTSNLTMEERISKTMGLIANIQERKDEYDKYVDSPLLNENHANFITKLPHTIYMEDSIDLSNPNIHEIEVQEFNSYTLVEEYEGLKIALAPQNTDRSLIGEHKANIRDYKCGFQVRFVIDRSKIGVYKLITQKVEYIIDRHSDVHEYEKYFIGKLKDEIIGWIKRAGLPINQEPIDLFKT